MKTWHVLAIATTAAVGGFVAYKFWWKPRHEQKQAMTQVAISPSVASELADQAAGMADFAERAKTALTDAQTALSNSVSREVAQKAGEISAQLGQDFAGLFGGL